MSACVTGEVKRMEKQERKADQGQEIQETEVQGFL